ncbi:MAG: hypothetical protein ACK4K6_15300, partial [Pseudarthrobacter sp.]
MRLVAATAALLSAVAALWSSTIAEDASYWLHLAPAMFVLALGFSLGVIALTQAAVYHVDPDKAEVASALLNSAQQIGVALGLAVWPPSRQPSPPYGAPKTSPLGRLH